MRCSFDRHVGLFDHRNLCAFPSAVGTWRRESVTMVIYEELYVRANLVQISSEDVTHITRRGDCHRNLAPYNDRFQRYAYMITTAMFFPIDTPSLRSIIFVNSSLILDSLSLLRRRIGDTSAPRLVHGCC
jgi:hypothetical protein